MLGIVIDYLISNSQLRCGGEGFAGAGIANKARMGAAGDLQANTLTWAEVVGSGPDVDLDVQAAVFLRGYAVWGEAYYAVAEVDRFARWLYDAETGEEVGVLQAGAHVEIGRDGADDFLILFEYGTGVDKDIRASFQFAVVFGTHSFPGTERVATNGRGWIGGIVTIVIWFRYGWWSESKRAIGLQVPAFILGKWWPVGKVAPLVCAHHE